jgi:uncharacterized protein
MDILGLSTSPSSGGAYALILSEAEGSRRLPIIIGTFEAQAIALELEQIKPPRPMTHDLLKSAIDHFDASVSKVVISELREGTFFAQIHIDRSAGNLQIDARPSDAIALAIRFTAPIYVENKVLNEAGIEAEPATEDTPKPPRKTQVIKSDQISVSIETKVNDGDQAKIELLERNMKAAIAAEDYELAAKLRDELQKLKADS